MGTVSFKYNTYPEFKHEALFKYLPSKLFEYNFGYKRYFASSNTSLFNSPVAIEKVATGFLDLRQLFVEKIAYSSYHSQTMIHKEGHSLPDNNEYGTIIHKLYHDTITDNMINMCRPYSSYMKILNNYFASEHITVLNKIDNVYLKRPRNGMCIYDNVMTSEYIMIANAYKHKYADRYMLLAPLFNNIMSKQDRNGLNIIKQRILHRDTLLNIYDSNIHLWKPRVFNLNVAKFINTWIPQFININDINWRETYTPFPKWDIYENINTARTNPGWNVLPVVSVKSDNYKKTNKIPLISIPSIYKITELFPFESIYTKDKISFKNDILNIVYNHKNANIYSLYNIYIDENICNIFKSKNIRTNDKYIKLIYPSIYMSQRIKNGYINKIVFQKYNFNGRSIILNTNHWAISSEQFIDSNNVLFSEKYNKKSDIAYSAFAKSENNRNAIFNKNIFSEKLDKSSWYILSGNFAAFNFKDVFYSSINTGTKEPWNTHESYNVFALAGKKDTIWSQYNLFAKNTIRDIMIKNFSFSLKNDSKVYIQYVENYSYKIFKDVFISSNVYVFRPQLLSSIFKDDFAYKCKQNIYTGINDGFCYLFGYKPDVIINQTNNTMKTDIIFGKKSSFDFSIHDDIGAVKTSREIHRYTSLFVKNKHRDILLFNTNDFIIKTCRNISMFPSIFNAYKEKKLLSLFTDSMNIFKSLMDLYVDFSGEFIFKQYVDIDFCFIDAYDGLIIPISKVRHQAFIDYVDEMAFKTFKDIFISYGSFASVIPKDTRYLVNLDLFCDKERHNVYIEYRNLWAIKEAVRGFIQNGAFGNKLPKLSWTLEWVSGTKNGKQSFLTNIVSTWKDSKKVSINQWISGQKDRKSIIVHDDISSWKQKHDFHIFDNLFVDKDRKMCYYDYGEFSNKEKHEMYINLQDNAWKNGKSMQPLDLSFAVKDSADIFYEDYMLSSELLKNIELFNQIEEVHKIVNEMEILPNDFGNWVWVYENPDPLEKYFGIDELLLPERDTRYSDFEDIIFNKKTLRPRNPVKKIDENTFIAKYPIKHPTPNYEEIGIVYLDVETSIMHTIFLKYYRIWQSKIFEFSTMTMTQAVKKMLDYLYAWITLYFPVGDKMEQALRVFRQIRWYGEMAIIQNSQYIISYEYDVLESKLTTGDCHIPNDLDINDTMYVDKALGVIRNNPAYIGNNCFVTFTVNNKRNTIFSFSLSNTVGSVNIYINGKLINTVSTSSMNLSYELPYTGTSSIIKIEKTAANNLNNHFFIGYIRIPDCSFKDLSIEFDPMLKAGNKPLDEIAKKMIQYANLCDDPSGAYESIRKANLGVNETYKRMEEYWNLHHQNKEKGKRLTIKEV